MPKATSSPSSSDIDTKPYDRTSSPITPTKTKKRAAVPWSSRDRIKLFEAAITHGVSTKAFEGVVDGRSGKQCYDIWVKAVAPAIKRGLASGK